MAQRGRRNETSRQEVDVGLDMMAANLPAGAGTPLDPEQPLDLNEYVNRFVYAFDRSFDEGLLSGRAPLYTPGTQEYYEYFMDRLQTIRPRVNTRNSFAFGNVLPTGYQWEDWFTAGNAVDFVNNVIADTLLISEAMALYMEEPAQLRAYFGPNEVMAMGVWHRDDPDDPTRPIEFTTFFYISNMTQPHESLTVSAIKPKVNPKTGRVPRVMKNPHSRIGMGILLIRSKSPLSIPDPPDPPDVIDHPPPTDPPPEPPNPPPWPSDPDPPIRPPGEPWRSDVGYFVTLSDIKYYDEEPQIWDRLYYEFDFEERPLGVLNLMPGQEWVSEEVTGQVIRGLDVGAYGTHRLSYITNGDFSL
jgi:hypothetical protein